MKKNILPVTFLLSFFFTHAQDCKVKLSSIDGNYTGECSKGMANGMGKASGEDEYEGMFSKGVPAGQGMYTWKDGHYYIGNFEKGLKDGKGKMFYEGADGSDSVITGFWKKDKYIGEHAEPWEVLSTMANVRSVNCRKISKTGAEVSITLSQLTGAIPFVLSEIIITGSYERRSVQKLTNQSTTKYSQVTFPFRAVFNLFGQSAEIVFYDEGEYLVNIFLNQ